MLDYTVEATDKDGYSIKETFLASSEKEAGDMFLSYCGWNFPDKEFDEITVNTEDIRKRLKGNG